MERKIKQALLILAFGISTMTACKKDRFCECTSSEYGYIEKTEYKKVTKKAMKNGLCVSYTEYNDDGTVSDTYTCEIK